MKRRKRFTIRLIALGFAIVGLSAAPAQARVDEGLGFQSASSTQQVTLAPDDRVDRVMPGHSVVSTPTLAGSSIRTADDLANRVTPGPGQPTVVSSDNGFDVGTTIGISGMVLLLGAIGVYLIVHQSQKGRFASA